MLNTLKLTHFQRHLQFEHTFGPGLTVCVGPNWAGKSTLLRAILYALFGTEATGIPSKGISTRGGQRAVVELGFTVDGVRYDVLRSQSKCELRRGDTLLATGTTGVTAQIESMIGPAKGFISYQVAEQGEVSHLLTLGSAALAKHINAVTGVDLVDQVLGQIKEERLLGKGRLHDSDYTRQTLERQQQAVASLEGELQGVEANLSLLKERKAKQGHVLSISYAGYQQAHENYAAWSRWYNAEQSRLAALASATDRLDAATAALQKLPDSDPQAALTAFILLTKQRQGRTELLEQQENVVRRMAQAEEELRALDGAAPVDLLPLRQEKKAADDAHQRAYARLLAKQAELNGAACPTCHRPFGTCNEAEVRLEVEALKADLAQAAERQHRAMLAVNSAERAYEAQAARQSWQATLRELSQHQAELTEKLKGLAQVSPEQVEAARVRHEQARDAASQRKVAEQALAQARQEVEANSQPAPEVPRATEQSVAAALRRYQEDYQASQETEQAISSTQARLDQISSSLATARTQHAELARQVSELEALELRMSRLDELGKYLRDNRDRFTQSAWDNLLRYAGAFVQAASDGAMQGLRRDAKGDFTYLENGEEMSLKLASGMQLAILGVAVKLALAAAIGSNFDVLLLDEVSAAASDENALRLTECLAATGQQVFLISHRPADAVVAQSVIDLY
ncbi:MAG: AAA family ATPase [Armatimonadia bacterium]